MAKKPTLYHKHAQRFRCEARATVVDMVARFAVGETELTSLIDVFSHAFAWGYDPPPQFESLGAALTWLVDKVDGKNPNAFDVCPECMREASMLAADLSKTLLEIAAHVDKLKSERN